MGKAGPKPTLEGKEYDHVVDIVIREGAPALKLGFNKADDPARVARDFCKRYMLGEEAMPQIIAYLQPLSNPLARAAREEAESAQRVTNMRYIPCWKYEGFITFVTATAKQFAAKIIELNAQLVEASVRLFEQARTIMNSMMRAEQSRLKRERVVCHRCDGASAGKSYGPARRRYIYRRDGGGIH
jgi:hypothetical protein